MAKVFRREELEAWLWNIIMNNVDDREYVSFIRDILERLDGFEKFVDYMRENPDKFV